MLNSHWPVSRRSFYILLAVALLAGLGVVTWVVIEGLFRDPVETSRAHQARAQNYIAEGKYKEAVLEYRNAVRYTPRSASLRYRLGEAYLKTGEAERAAREFVRAADLAPDDVSLQVTGAEALLALGRHDEARQRAERLVARDPRNVRGQVVLGRAKAFLKDLDGAVADLQEAIRVDPAQPQTHTTLGAVEVTRGNAAEAEDAFKKAIAVNPKYIEAHFALASLYLRQGKAADAEHALKAAIAAQPSNTLARSGLAILYVSTGRAPEAVEHLDAIRNTVKDAAGQIRLADLYIAAGRPDTAAAILEPIAGDKATGSEAAPRLAAIYYSRGEKPRAHAVLDEVIDRPGPSQLEALVLKARLLSAEKKFDQALKHANNAVKINSASVSGHYVLGTIHAARGDHDAAVKAFNEVLRLNPRATAAQVQLSHLQLAQGQAAQSLQTAEAAVKNAPGDPTSRLALARALIAKREYARAATELQNLRDKFPESAAVHAQLGYLAQMQNDVGRAVASYTEALKLDPASIEALGGLISIDLSRRDAEAAKRRIEARLAQGGADAPLLVMGGRLYARLGDLARAERLLQDAIAQDADNLLAYQVLGDVLVRAGKLDAAKSRFEMLAGKQQRPVAAHTMVGIILQTQNKRAEARARYERVLQIDPEAAVAANNLAWMLAEDNASPRDALRLALIAKRKLPQMAEVDDTLGWILYKNDKVDEAVDALRRSVELKPDNPVYHYHLGMAYVKYGDWTRGAESLRRSLAISSTFAGAAEARATLGRVGSTAARTPSS